MYINYSEENILEDEVKEVELTKGQKEFIGTEFPTPKGGVLTVIGVIGKNGSGASVFGLECSICSQDEELWSEGSIRGVKGGLVSGRVPCGCAKNPYWTEEQTRIRVERECKKKGYIFNDWLGNYKGKNTKLDLYNPKTGNNWKSTSVSSFFSGTGDPVEGVQSKLITDKQRIEDFLNTGKYIKGTRFWRSDRLDNRSSKNYWEYTCPTCTNDKYVKNGLCSGVFESHVSSLKKGQHTCRCSNSYRWTQQQREYQLQSICKEKGYTFMGWELDGGYKNAHSKFKWECDKGHSNATAVYSFTNIGSRCMECKIQKQKESGNLYGYYPQRVEEDDTLYLLILGKGTCIKVGRTFVKTRGNYNRLKSIENGSGLSVEKILTVYGKHKDIYDLEQSVLNDKYITKCEHMTFDGSTELLKYSDLGAVCEILEGICSSDDRFTLKYE